MNDGPNALYHTEPVGLPNEAERVAAGARAIGLRLMPWQMRALEVATEHDDGAYRHPIVVVSVPRQSGKSTMLKALVLDRLANGGLGGTWEGALLAQTRQDAARFIVDWSDHSDVVPMRTYRGIGNEKLQLGGNQVRPYAPAPSAMHGRSLNSVLWDETWAVDLERGREILQAAAPSMITKRDRQTWMVSTAGSADSVFFREWIEKGRAGEVCLIEYAAPADADVEDVAGWADWHPAFGHTQDAEGIAQARAMFTDDEAGFRRAYCNQWPEAQATRGAVDPEHWQSCLVAAPPVPAPGESVLAVDVDPFALSASIVAAWRHGASAHVELVDHRDGVAWLLPRLRELLGKHQARQVWSQDYGPVVATLDALERERVPVERIPSKTASAAVQAMLTAIGDGSVTHHGQDELTRSVLAVGTRPFGDGLQWQRKDAGRTSPITAATWAHWGLLRAKKRGSLRIIVAS